MNAPWGFGQNKTPTRINFDSSDENSYSSEISNNKSKTKKRSKSSNSSDNLEEIDSYSYSISNDTNNDNKNISKQSDIKSKKSGKLFSESSYNEEEDSSSYSSDNQTKSKTKKPTSGYFVEDPLKDLNGGPNWWHSNFSHPSKSVILRTVPVDTYDSAENTSKNTNSSHKGEAIDDNDEESSKTYIVRDKKSPLIWTIGYCVMSVIVVGCAFYFEKGFVPMNENPFFGYSESTIISFGAKQGYVMQHGGQWRILTANAVHAGVIHLVLNCAMIAASYRVEMVNGFFTAMLTFLFGGTFGFLVSVLLTPDYTSCGSGGGIFTWLGFSIVRYIVFWELPYVRIFTILIVVSAVLLVIEGLLPFNDNFCNISGLVVGLLISLTLLPNTNASKCLTYIRTILALIAFPLMAVLFCVAFVFYLRKPDIFLCEKCVNALCVDFSFARWCPPPFY